VREGVALESLTNRRRPKRTFFSSSKSKAAWAGGFSANAAITVKPFTEEEGGPHEARVGGLDRRN